MKKLISFSLWGENPKYTIGAIENAKLAKVFYPGWAVRFYVSSFVDSEIKEQLKSLSAEIIEMPEKGNWTSMFWRFQAGFDPTVDLTIFRDTDSRLNSRERLAVEEWEMSDKTFHIMRDHPCHRFPILGGMWGVKNKQCFCLESLLESFEKTDNYGTDYQFFIEKLYPLIDDDKVVHDEFFDGQPFPSERIGLQFVGEVFDENNQRNEEHSNILKNHNDKHSK